MVAKKKFFFYYCMSVVTFACCLCIPATSQVHSSCKIMIRNNSSIPFKNKVVEVKWPEVLVRMKVTDTSKLIVVDPNGQQIPYQFETKGQGSIQNLLLQVNVAARSTISVTVKMGVRKVFASKTFCRFVPERYDDFAWENDKIAFRMYGKALEATAFNAYGIDVWAKRTNKLVINKWYKLDNYHADNGEGCDFYGVGYSLGAGNITPMLNDSIYYSKNYTRYEVLDNGPLRSSFKLYYDTWMVGGYATAVVKTIQLDAGDQLNKITAEFQFDGIDSLPVVIGINKKEGNDVKLFNEQHRFMGYWLPKDSTNGTIGVGSIFPAGLFEMNYSKKHLLARQTAKNKVPIIYYAGACWDKAGVFASEQIWFNYLKEFTTAIKQPLSVIVN